ncbi:MAG: transcriptional repressor LexA [Actinomycetota bacterium]|jgi:repressor LexA|nr:transcriptional repressor LexA [Actinomycetota bacterium]
MAKKTGLTGKQDIFLKEIYKFISENNYPPSVRELASISGFSSPKGAADHLNTLIKKGYLQRNPSPRSLKLTEKAFWYLKMPNPFNDSSILYLPLLGRIAAGKPIFAEENIDEYVPISKQVMGRAEGQFLLRVNGDSMSGDHIMDGDMLIVKIQDTAENGDIVAALLNDEAVVKRFYKRSDGTVELVSSNPLYEPIVLKDGVRIQGKVIAVYRHIF